MEDEDKKSLSDGLKESVNLLGNIGRIQDGIVAINSGFGESRQRVLEFNNVLADSAGGIKRLGGNITDVAATVTEIAQGARRNVVATTDVVTDLFAVSQFLGKETSGIVDSFAAAGIEMTTIGDTILESVQYVQSVGLNAKTIMGSVVEQTDLLNRFNFDGGVQGFTRMAAQASMVRLDMSKTAAFADKVMNPQGALETAQAFQRLGVAAGTLIDPFALMDASINDPEGLQDSLIEMTRQFTQFNDETGRFEINPGGVRLMHDLAEAAGMTYKEFSQVALSSADLDRRLSQISFNINAPEEDKLLIANMAKMGEGGRYFVEIEDAGKVDLANITEEQMGMLRKQYEDTPKTMEDILRSQKGTFELMRLDIQALPYQIGYAIAGQSGLAKGLEMVREVAGRGADSIFEATPSGEELRKSVEGLGDEFQGAVGKILSDNTEANRQNLLDMLSTNTELLKEGTLETALSALENFKADGDMQKNQYYKAAMSLLNKVDTSSIENVKNTAKGALDKISTTNVNFDGEIDLNINVPPGTDARELTRYINTPEFKEFLYNTMKEQMDKANVSLPKKGG